jgi:endonuclease/exonuclease/phosphatase family metal-dependent hydrolase
VGAVALGLVCLWLMATDTPRLTVVQWNVENLFDNEDDPANEADDEFLPSGWWRWDEDHYEIKLGNLADILARLRGHVVCLQEVENRRVLQDLCDLLRRRHGMNYAHIIHRDGPDHRGIDVAVLSMFEPVAETWITPVEKQRDVLIAMLKPHGHEMTLLVNHWKSRWGGRAKTQEMRDRQAAAVRAEVDALLTDGPRAAVMVVGDLNEDFGDPCVTDRLRAVSDLGAVLSDPEGRLLFNLHATLNVSAQGTIYYRRDAVWNSFDQMCVSRAMVDDTGPAGWRVKKRSYRVPRWQRLLLEDGTPKPFRPVRDPATGKYRFLEGYSDHLPVTVELELR